MRTPQNPQSAETSEVEADFLPPTRRPIADRAIQKRTCKGFLSAPPKPNPQHTFGSSRLNGKRFGKKPCPKRRDNADQGGKNAAKTPNSRPACGGVDKNSKNGKSGEKQENCLGWWNHSRGCCHKMPLWMAKAVCRGFFAVQ